MRKTNVVRLLPEKEALWTLHAVGDRVSCLWNAGNYICRQAFIGKEKVPNYSALCALMKDSADYKALPTHIGQEVLKKLSKSWISFFALRRSFAKGEIRHKPGMPKYRKDRKKGSRPWDYIPVKSTAAYCVEGCLIHLAVPADIYSQRIAIPFRGTLRYQGDFKTCELLYDNAKKRWYAHIVVEYQERVVADERPEKHAGGDIGARRAIAVSTQGNPQSVVYSSRQAWKDYKYWSRLIAKEKTRLSKQGYKTSRRLQMLYRIRRLRLRHAMEALCADIVQGLRRSGVTHFTVGYPVNCRDNANFGKGNELVHNFWNFEILLRIIEKHCIRAGIAFKRVDERGTSSHCHICGRKVRRPKTDIVVCPVHGIMHADVNASRNILRKVTPALAGDGEKASPGWVVMRWNLHRWQSHAESANNRVLQEAAHAAA
ncbi:MAG TPA: transposase [Nitrospiraceae bacterium]|nr:transposase [Nitrospiraceae bacterium]